MILKKLRLENFLAHRETEVEFSERGITVFIGENGAGKSSIIEGILYGLFGKTDKGNTADLIHWGKNQAKVELEFKKGSSEYRIERVITQRGKRAVTSSTVYKKEKGRFIPYFQKNVSREIPKLTGLTQKTFLSSVLVKQGDIEGLLDLSPRERAKVLEDILDMTLYQIVAENVANIRRSLQSTVEALKTALQPEEEIQKELKKINTQIRELNEEKSKTKRFLQEKEKEIKKLNEHLEFLMSEREKNIKNKAKIEKSKEIIKISQENIDQLNSKLKEINSLKTKIPELEKQISKLKKYEEDLKKISQLLLLEEKIRSVNEKIKEYREKKEKYENLKATGQKYSELEKELKEIKDKIKNAEKLKGEKKAVERQLKASEEKIEKLLTDLSTLVEKLVTLKRSYLILKDNPLMINQFLQNNEEKINDLIRKKEETDQQKGSLKTEGEQIKKKIKELTGIKGECPTCSRPLDKHTKEELIKHLEKELDQKREQFKQLNKKEKEILSQLEIERKSKDYLLEFKKLFQDFTENQKENKKLKAKLTALTGEINKLSKLYEKEKEIEQFLKQNKDNYHLFKEAERYLKNTDFNKLQENFSRLNNSLKELTKQVNPSEKDRIEKEISSLRNLEKEYTRIKQIISEEEKIKSEIEKLQNEVKLNQKIIEKAEKELTDQELIEKNIEETKKNLSQIQSETQRTRDELSKLEEALGKAEGIKEALLKNLEKIKTNLHQIKTLESKIEKYHKIEFALGPKGIQKVIRENALSELPKVTNIIFSAFGFPFQQIKFSEDFDILLLAPTLERTERYVPVSSISGGQKVALGLALRLAVGRFLSNKADFLILDEPTVHLDQQRRSDLINILINLKEKRFVNQLILVTHDTEIEDAADSIYYVEGGDVKPIT